MDLFAQDSVGQALFILCSITVLGMVIGTVRVLSFRIGVAGILFVGLVFGHFGVSVDAVMWEFARDLGLILFVYSFGQEVGPGLLSSLKQAGRGAQPARRGDRPHGRARGLAPPQVGRHSHGRRGRPFFRGDDEHARAWPPSSSP